MHNIILCIKAKSSHSTTYYETKPAGQGVCCLVAPKTNDDKFNHMALPF